MTEPKGPRRRKKAAARHSPQHMKAIAEREGRGGRPRITPGPPKRAPYFIPKPTEADAAFIRSLILYEDEAVMAFAKPSGLSSQGGRGGGLNMDDLLYVFAKPSGQRPGLVHRLDRETSGLLLAARTRSALGFMGKAMIARQFSKTYVCMVSAIGRLESEGVIDQPLRREDIGRESYSRISTPEHPDAQMARSEYRILARHDDRAVVEVRPQTGRMHQIRVHLAHMGAPIAGDARYGGALWLGGLKIPRLMLHALSLDFPHPAGGRRRLTCPVAEDMQATVAASGFSEQVLRIC